MLNIQDIAFLSIEIDGEEVPYAFIQSVELTEGNGALFPAFRIVMGDPNSTYMTGEKALTDGNKFSITIGKSMSDKNCKPRKYRLFGKKPINRAELPQMLMVGIVDAPNLVYAKPIEAYKGTSDAVLKQIAEKAGLQYTGPSSFNGGTMNDSQVWRNSGKNRGVFTQDIARRGWMSPKSGMGLTVTSFCEMRYRNLVDVINTPLDKIQYIFSHNAPKGDSDNNKKFYFVKFANDHSSAGITSGWQNYGSVRTQPGLDGEDSKSDRMEVAVPGKYVAVNQEIAAMVGKVRRDVAPVDMGNSHENYEKAYFQNIKVLALFSQKISVLVEQVTDVQLYDPVIYKQANADPTEPVSTTDVYIVVGKTVSIKAGIFYAERIELARLSLNMKGTAELKQCGSGAAENIDQQSMPDVQIDKKAGDATRSSVQSNLKQIRTGIAQIKSLVAGIKNLRSVMSGNMKPVLDALNELQRQIGVRDPAMAQTVAALIAGVTTLQSNAYMLNNRALLSQTLTNNLLKSLANQMPLIRTSTLTSSDSTISSLGSQASMNIPLLRTSHAMQNITSRIPNALLGTNLTQNLYATINAFDSTVLGACGSWVKEWNMTAGAIKGNYDPNFDNIGTSQLPQIIDASMRNPTLSDDQLNSMLTSGLYRTDPYVAVQGYTAKNQSNIENALGDLRLYNERMMGVSNA